MTDKQIIKKAFEEIKNIFGLKASKICFKNPDQVIPACAGEYRVKKVGNVKAIQPVFFGDWDDENRPLKPLEGDFQFSFPSNTYLKLKVRKTYPESAQYSPFNVKYCRVAPYFQIDSFYGEINALLVNSAVIPGISVGDSITASCVFAASQVTISPTKQSGTDERLLAKNVFTCSEEAEDLQKGLISKISGVLLWATGIGGYQVENGRMERRTVMSLATAYGILRVIAKIPFKTFAQKLDRSLTSIVTVSGYLIVDCASGDFVDGMVKTPQNLMSLLLTAARVKDIRLMTPYISPEATFIDQAGGFVKGRKVVLDKLASYICSDKIYSLPFCNVRSKNGMSLISDFASCMVAADAQEKPMFILAAEFDEKEEIAQIVVDRNIEDYERKTYSFTLDQDPVAEDGGVYRKPSEKFPFSIEYVGCEGYKENYYGFAFNDWSLIKLLLKESNNLRKLKRWAEKKMITPDSEVPYISRVSPLVEVREEEGQRIIAVYQGEGKSPKLLPAFNGTKLRAQFRNRFPNREYKDMSFAVSLYKQFTNKAFHAVAPLVTTGDTDLVPGKEYDFILFGLGLGIQESKYEPLVLDQGPLYELALENFLKEHSDKTEDDFKSFEISLDSMKFIDYGEEECTYKFKSPVLSATKFQFLGEEIIRFDVEIPLEYIPDYENPFEEFFRLPIYVNAKSVKNFDPLKVKSIEGSFVLIAHHYNDFSKD